MTCCMLRNLLRWRIEYYWIHLQIFMFFANTSDLSPIAISFILIIKKIEYTFLIPYKRVIPFLLVITRKVSSLINFLITRLPKLTVSPTTRTHNLPKIEWIFFKIVFFRVIITMGVRIIT